MTQPLRIVVTVKHVSDAQKDRSFTAEHTVERSESILSELDEYAVEAALRLVEAHGGKEAAHRVIALAVGPASATATVRKALQMGADEGVHVTDDALAGSDAAGTSRVLAAALEHIGEEQGPVDLVLTGMSSTDGETSLVPAQLAERLGLAQITFAGSLQLNDRMITARRDTATQTLVLEADLPALVSVTDRANEPRYPNFKSIVAAKKKPLATWSLADLGVDPSAVGTKGATARVLTAEPRPARQQGTVIRDEGQAATELVDFLAAQRLL